MQGTFEVPCTFIRADPDRLLLTGCVTLRDPEASFEYNGDIVATIDASHSVGQSFISRRPGLVNVQLYLRKASAQALDSDILSAALYHSPQDSQPLVTIPITYSQITRSFPVTIAFPAQNDPPGQSYYLLLSTSGGAAGALRAGRRRQPGRQPVHQRAGASAGCGYAHSVRL